MKKVRISQFERGEQGLIHERGYATNRVHMVRTWGTRTWGAPGPLRQIKLHYIRSGGQKWPLRWYDEESRFELALPSGWDVSFNSKGKVTIKRKG